MIARSAGVAKHKTREGRVLIIRRTGSEQPTIDGDHCAAPVIGQIDGEELDHLGAVIERPEPAQGDLPILDGTRFEPPGRDANDPGLLDHRDRTFSELLRALRNGGN
jgi:hypothetical protein